MRQLLSAITILLFPNVLTVRLLNLLGHKVHPKSYIGFSLILTRRIYMAANSHIGHLNIIQVQKLLLREKAVIKTRNRIRGAMNIILSKEAVIANSNSIFRAASPVTYGNGTLYLGQLALIVSKHHLDCTRSISIGAYSTIGGLGTQFWTHGYYHAAEGRDRIRIDGPINIGNNVYVGTSCTFNPAVSIASGINIGSNVCVSKSLTKSGMYVAQPLRYIEKDIRSIRLALDKVTVEPLVEEVYKKATTTPSSQKIIRYEQVGA